MTSLIFFAVAGLILFLAFLVIGFEGVPKSAPDSSAVTAVRHMVQLEGLSFAHFERLFDPADYSFVCSHPGLRRVAKQFLKDRKDLVVAWIGMLAGDLKKLWRFRRFLVRRGAPTSFAEEFRVFCAFAVSICLLGAMRVLIRVVGPFALPNTARRIANLVETMSYAPARVLSLIPAAGWPEVERKWGSLTL